MINNYFVEIDTYLINSIKCFVQSLISGLLLSKSGHKLIFLHTSHDCR